MKNNTKIQVFTLLSCQMKLTLKSQMDEEVWKM